MIELELKASFSESIRPIGPEEDRIPGFKNAIINENALGHVLDPEALRKAKSIPYLHLEVQFKITQGVVDLAPFLNSDAGGREWFGALQEHYKNNISTEMTLQELPFSPVKYTKYPEDYFDRSRANKNWRVPRGIIEKLPQEARYMKLGPMLKTKDGRWIQNVYYNRKVKSANGVTEDYGIIEKERDYGNAAGIIMGNLQKRDFTKVEGDFETQFPFEHFLEVVYPVRIMDLGHNPLKVEIHLVR
jgi:hypothetical protein